ncbi:P-loop containing nucleoside triphosphate hydrolase [Abortiporus biennis]
MSATKSTSDSTIPIKIEKENVTIAIMGATGTGKSTFINLVGGSSLPVGHGLEACTKEVMPSNIFTLDDVPVVLLDTPGFDDTVLSDFDVLTKIASYLAESLQQGVNLSGIMYLHL